MKPALKPGQDGALEKALNGIMRSLDSLESAIDKRLAREQRILQEPQFTLPSNDREINRKIAAKLDQTIHRLEALLEE